MTVTYTGNGKAKTEQFTTLGDAPTWATTAWLKWDDRIGGISFTRVTSQGNKSSLMSVWVSIQVV